MFVSLGIFNRDGHLLVHQQATPSPYVGAIDFRQTKSESSTVSAEAEAMTLH